MFGDENFGDFISFKEALPGHAKASVQTYNQTNEFVLSSQSDTQSSSQESQHSSNGSESTSESEFFFYDRHKTGQLVKLANDNSVTIAAYLKYFSKKCRVCSTCCFIQFSLFINQGENYNEIARRERFPSSHLSGRKDFTSLVNSIHSFFVPRVFPNNVFSKYFNDYFFRQLKVDEPRFTDQVVV